MTVRSILLKEIETLPAACIDEVADFVTKIKQRKPTDRPLLQIPETMQMSEAALSKEWDTSEEDEAWASL